MNKLTKTIVGVFCALMLASAAFAADVVKAAPTATVTQPAPTEQWAVTLGGVGQTVTSGDLGTAVGFDPSVGRTGHLLLPLEAGLRQAVTFDGDSTTLLTTKGYADWTLFTVAKKVDVFAGGNIGLLYGNTTPTWVAAPEAGLRWWVKKDVAVLVRAEVPFNLTDGRYTQTVGYFVGFSVRF